LDLVVGDPHRLTHPTQVMGWLIERLEKFLRALAAGPKGQLVVGGVLAALVVAVSWLVTYAVLAVVNCVLPLAAYLLGAWLLSTTIAWRGLAAAGMEIYRSLKDGDLVKARSQVDLIVGRDTENLSTPEVVRATVETIAENASDGIIAPLFYSLIGGVPLAMAYRAVNTLDSMLGYRDENYLYFGRAAARLDDIANYLPARITGFFLCLGAVFAGGGFRRAWLTMCRYARCHPSPNSGFPEAAAAGALGVRLGGTNYYRGEASRRPFIGEPYLELVPDHIIRVIKLMSLAILFFSVISSILLWGLTVYLSPGGW